MGTRSGATIRAGKRRVLRRTLLGALALGVVASPALHAGCVSGFESPSLVKGLRVLAVQADNPYPRPGDTVTFKMTYHDSLLNSQPGREPVSIFWIGGCYNPVGDQYFACFNQISEIGEIFASLSPGDPIPQDVIDELLEGGNNVGLGNQFQLTIKRDILEGRTKPPAGPKYGLVYVFFAACAGHVDIVQPGATGRAGDFPFGCFNAQDQQLGADSFVPGYTQLYVFEDEEIKNTNPRLDGLKLDDKEMKAVVIEGEPTEADLDEIPEENQVERCDVTVDERRATGCGTEDPLTACKAYELKAIVPEDVAEDDTTASDLKEIVWVNYFADKGDIDGGIKLVNDASKGFNDDNAVKWIPPAEPGLARIWAVLRDARGGASVVERVVRVK